MISSPGIGSGLDVNGIVSQLVEIERQPLQRLAREEVGIQAKISAFGQLKGALSEFRDALSGLNDIADFDILAASSSDEEVLAVSLGTNASIGTHNIDVLRLAENHRLAAGTTLPDSDTTTVGAAGETMTIDVGGSAFTVEIGGKTLDEIRAAINSAADNSGARATLFNDGTSSRLMLSAEESGAESFITVSYSGADPFSFSALNEDRDANAGFNADDLNAEILVEGQFSVTQGDNSFDGVIQGVNMQLVTPGTATISVQENTAELETRVQGFADAYNAALTSLRDLRSKTLDDDANVLYAIENQMRGVLNAVTRGTGNAYQSIFEIGFSSSYSFGSSAGDNGKLSLDKAALSSALREDPDAVAQLFAAPDTGVIKKMDALVKSFVTFEGLIDGKTSSLQARVEALGGRKAALERRIALTEQRLLDQFNGLDTLMAQLNSTGSLVTQQLSQLQPIQR